MVTVGLLHELKEILVLLHSSLLLINTLGFLLKYLQPELLLLDFLILILDLFIEFRNLFFTLAHGFRVEVKVVSELDNLLLDL
jgi:hypothetical protein